MKTVHIKWWVGTCRVCGDAHPGNTMVMGAVGVYCPTHAGPVSVMASDNADSHIAKGLAAGKICLPAPPYDPLNRSTDPTARSASSR